MTEQTKKTPSAKAKIIGLLGAAAVAVTGLYYAGSYASEALANVHPQSLADVKRDIDQDKARRNATGNLGCIYFNRCPGQQPSGM